MKTLKSFLATSAFALSLVPLLATAQASGGGNFQSDGIYGCNQTGSYSMSVGAMSAIGGVYVPVNDAAVTLNTGYLVYKECVLRGIVDDERKSATSALIKKYLTDYMTDRNGGPLFSQNINIEQANNADAALVKSVQGGDLDALNPAFKASVTRAVIRRYQQATRRPGSEVDCSFSGDMTPVLTGQTFAWDAFMAEGDPGCNPMFAEELASNVVLRRTDAAIDTMMTKLEWGHGTYDMQTTDSNGNAITVTPASIVNALTEQAVTSGFRQTENANDIGQMLNALFAGIGTQIIGDSQGLNGLTQSSNGQLSYIDQVAKQSADQLVNTALNAALQILNAARTVETTYNQVITNIFNNINQTIQSLHTAENQCWNQIIQHVCADTVSYSSGRPTCTALDTTSGTSTSGALLHIATTTTASQSIIDANNLTQLAQNTNVGIQNSNSALVSINRLIASISNTTSRDAQTIALQQLETLVRNNAIHNQNDVANAQSQLTAVQASTANILSATQAWGSSMDVGTGWCNVNNPAVIEYWKSRWSN